MEKLIKTRQRMSDHFSQLASSYRYLRTADLEPVMFVRDVLDSKQGIEAADIGCGAGRYCLRFLKHLNIRHRWDTDFSRNLGSDKSRNRT